MSGEGGFLSHLKAYGQHHHIEDLFLHLAGFGDVAKADMIGIDRLHRMNPGTDETHAFFTFGAQAVFIEIFSMGPKIHEEHGGVQRLVTMLLGDDGLFYRNHTTHR